MFMKAMAVVLLVLAAGWAPRVWSEGPSVDGMSGASWHEPPLPPIGTSELRQQIRDWLSAHWMLTLATASADGEPHISPVVYFSEDLVVYIRAERQTNKIRNIEENPRVAYTVWKPAGRFEQVRSLQVAGRAHVLTGPARERVLRLFRNAPGSQQSAIRDFLPSEASPEEEVAARAADEKLAVVMIEPLAMRWIERALSPDQGQVLRPGEVIETEPE